MASTFAGETYIIIWTILALTHFALSNERCRELRYIGGRPVKMTKVHKRDLRILLGKIYNISADGEIIAWQFWNGNPSSRFYFDVWERITELQYKLINKTPAFDKPVGLNTVVLTTPIPVKRGHRLGLHISSGFTGGVSTGYSANEPSSDFPNFGREQISDDKKFSNGYVVEGTSGDLRKHAKKFAFGAILLIDRSKSEPNCYQVYTRNPAIDVSKAAQLSTTHADDITDCARLCFHMERCMTFKYIPSKKECIAHPAVIETLENPDDSVEIYRI